MRLIGTKLLCAVLTVAVLVGCQQDTWEGFSSHDGAFSVLMPGSPTVGEQTGNLATGPIILNYFELKHREAHYVVSYTDYPPEAVQQTNPADMLDGATRGALKNVEEGRLVSESVISLNGYPGREFEIEAPNSKQTVHCRSFLVENRLYMLLMVVPTGEQSSNTQKFFESFTLLEQ